MVSFRFAALMAVVASPLLAAAQDTTTAPSSTVIKNPITTPTTTLPARAMELKGCFATGVPLENHGSYLYRTDGNCQLVCLQEGKNVMGVSDGENCWCGDLLPPADSKVDDSKCNTPCSGDKTRKLYCGGPGMLYVALTGKSLNEIPNYEPPASSSSSSTPTATSKPATTSSAPANNETESKPNTVAIAVGVVVGLVALAGIGVGIWFFLRRRRQRQAEEDYRRNAANVNAFVNGGKGHTATSSLNDSRLDPSFMDRRTSSGSIADNEDYSRRILKVTNA